METTIDNQVNKIKIGIFSIKGIGETFIEDLEKINNISTLLKVMHEKAKIDECFVDSPALTRFRLTLYKDMKPFKNFRIAGHFIRYDDEWYWTGDMRLDTELKDYTKNARLKNPVWNGPAWV